MICALSAAGLGFLRRIGRPTGLLLAMLLVAVCARAQPDRDPQRTRTAGSSTNLFVNFESAQPTAGFEVDLPPDWRLQGATVLRYGSERLPTEIQSDETPARIQLAQPVRGPVEVVLRVRVGARPGRATWTITPYSMGDEPRPRPRTADRRSQDITLRPPTTADASNAALRFSEDAAAPLLLSPDAFAPLNGRGPFTVEFWVRTVALDAVVLSTWTGDEDRPYPLEIVTDAGGRLRAYTGRPDRHQALRSRQPIADGEWHHVGVSYNPAGGQMRLFFDGNAIDSLSGVSMPLRGNAPVLAVGGRLPPDRESNPPAAAFAGRIDELRVWNRVRRSAGIRQLMRRTGDLPIPVRTPPVTRLNPQASDDPPPVFVVDDALDARDDRSSRSVRGSAGDLLVRPWPAGVERVPSTLPVQDQLQNLRAQTGDGRVTLEWESPSTSVQAFVVEQSTDGQTFRRTATIRPEPNAAAAASASFTYTDESVPGQVAYYRIRQVYTDGTEQVSGTLKIGLGTSAEEQGAVHLIGNFPNPFNASTTVCFEVRESVRVTLTVWDVTGQQVAQLADQTYGPGYYELPFDARSRPSGTYFLRLETTDGIQSHRMVVLQ